MPSTATSSRADGNQLTVKGAFAVRRDRVARLHRTVLVNVGAEHEGAEDRHVRHRCSTRTRCRSVNTSSRSARSTEPATDATPATFDATNGRVRMLPTHLHGAVNAAAPGQINLDLRGDRPARHRSVRLRRHRHHCGAGRESGRLRGRNRHACSCERDAPAKRCKSLGFVRPFGSAPADFEGRTVVDYREPPALLGIGWGTSGTTAPFLSMGANGLVLDLDNPSIGARHALLVGMRQVDLLTLPDVADARAADNRARAVRHLGRPRHPAVHDVRGVQHGARRDCSPVAGPRSR